MTLVELLVVIAIIGLLVALLMPAVQMARSSARRTSCSNNMRQIGLALHGYESTHKVLPPGSTNDVEQGGWILRPRRKHIHSWLSMILPQLEAKNLSDRINYNVSSMDAANLPVASQIVPFYRCPSYAGADYSTAQSYVRFSVRYAIGNYVAMGASDVGHIYGQNTGLFKPDGSIYPLSNTKFSEISDGLSNTVVAVETRETRMAGCGADPVAILIGNLQDEDVQVRRSAARRLADLGSEAAPAISAISQAIDDEDREVRRLAIHAISQVGPQAASYLPALKDALDDDEWSVRIAAAIAINRIDPSEVSHQSVLIAAMNSGEGGIIVQVGEMGANADWAVPTLIELLADRRPGIRRITANALEQIGPAALAAKPVLEKVAISDPDERVREAAQQVLDRMNEHG